MFADKLKQRLYAEFVFHCVFYGEPVLILNPRSIRMYPAAIALVALRASVSPCLHVSVVGFFTSLCVPSCPLW